MRGDTFTISILCRSHFWECANTQWLAEKTWVFVSWMFNEGLAHRKFFTRMQTDGTWVISVYMFSKLSILLFVLPFLTSLNVLYLSVPDLSTSLGKKRPSVSHMLSYKQDFLQKVTDLNCFVSSDSFSSSLADSRSLPSSSNSTVMSASISTYKHKKKRIMR